MDAATTQNQQTDTASMPPIPGSREVFTPEIALKIVDGLAPKYRQDPELCAAMVTLFARVGAAKDFMEVRNLNHEVARIRKQIDERTK